MERTPVFIASDNPVSNILLDKSAVSCTLDITMSTYDLLPADQTVGNCYNNNDNNNYSNKSIQNIVTFFAILCIGLYVQLTISLMLWIFDVKTTLCLIIYLLKFKK